MTFTGEQGERREIQTKKDWETRRQEILEAMQEVMGRLPDSDTKAQSHNQ